MLACIPQMNRIPYLHATMCLRSLSDPSAGALQRKLKQQLWTSCPFWNGCHLTPWSSTCFQMWSLVSARELCSSLKVSVWRTLSSLQSTRIVETVVVFSLWSQLSHLDFIKLQRALSYLTLCLFGYLGLWKLCCCAPGAVYVLLLLLLSSLQVWPMPCWLLCLQFMACTRPSTQSCSIPSLVHPDIYP